MEKTLLDLILDKINGRELSQDDERLLQEWLSSEGNRQTFSSVKALWTDVRKVAGEPFDKKVAVKKLDEQIYHTRSRSVVVARLAFAAAVVALAVLVPFLWKARVQPAVTEQVLSEVTAPLGSHTRFRLSDGTIVVLNAGSTLRYASSFGEADRDVVLDGEGYFEVTSNPELPFIVKAGGCDFRVLGTKFNITAYPDEILTAALMEGSLKVSSASDTTVMAPGEIVSVDEASSSLTKVKGDVFQHNSWVSGFLRFDNINLNDLIARLSREYNVTIEQNASGLDDLGLRISFNLSEPVEDILGSLCSIIPVRVSYHDGKYEIRNK